MDPPGATVGPAPAPAGWRLLARSVLPLAFCAALLTASFYAVFTPGSRSARARPSRAIVSNVYPHDPVDFNVPAVQGPLPVAATADTVAGKRVLTTLAQMARVLPRGALRRAGRSWLLTRPAAVTGRAVLRINRGRSLEIAPGAFLVSASGGQIILRHVVVTGVGADSRPMLRSVSGRGFLDAEGGRLWLDHVRLSHLGYLGTHAFGLSFSSPLPGSGVVHSTVEDLYRGVYTTKAVRVQIVDNLISDSVEYGIDPHTDSTDLAIEGNRVIRSGLHGIILAVAVQRSRVVGNVVDGAGDHGIVLFDTSNDNTVVGNIVVGTFDGIVVMSSSNNLISGNVVHSATRFGLRISGPSRANLILSNDVSSRILAAYLYGGAAGNLLQGNRFQGQRQDVRIRADAPGNRILPPSPAPPAPRARVLG
ncbi:MAG TPA: NosD domain-containing protein [Actinomycetota bacterium]